MQPTITIRQTVLWLTLATIVSCNKDNPGAAMPSRDDPETLDIPVSFEQNILLHGFTSMSCSVCPVLDETVQKAYRHFKGRLSAIILHRDELGIAAGDSVFRFFHITGVPAWFYFPVRPDSTTFLTMTQRFGISIASSIRGDSGFVKVVTGFSDDVSTPVKIAVWLTEDSIAGQEYSQSVSYNSDLSLPFYNLVSNMDNFQHNHVLRKVISSSVFGEMIEPTRTIAGVRDVRNYAFEIPANSRKNKLRLIAFAYTGVYLYGMVNNVQEVKLGETKLWN